MTSQKYWERFMFITLPTRFFMRPVTSLALEVCNMKEFDPRSHGMVQGPTTTAFLWVIQTWTSLGSRACMLLGCFFFFRSHMGVLRTLAHLCTGFRMWVKLHVSRRGCGWSNLTTMATDPCWRSFISTQCFEVLI